MNSHILINALITFTLVAALVFSITVGAVAAVSFCRWIGIATWIVTQ